MVTATEAADKRREARKKTGQAKQAAGKYKSVAPSEAAVKNTTYNDPVKDKDNNKKPTPAPKAKAVQKNNTANVIAGRQARGLSMLEDQNKRRDRQGKVVSAADAGYGYIDANGKFVDAYTDATNGGGPGRAGPEFQTKRQAMESKTGGEKSGTLASFLGATPKNSNLEPTGLAKLAYDGGIFGTMAKGIAGGVKNLVKPATYEVQKNDNLAKIATANNMTLEQLLAKNPGLDPKTAIQPGQQIKIGGLFGAGAGAPTVDMGGDNDGIASVVAPTTPVTKCPPGYMLDPKTNACVPDMQAFANKGAVAIPGVVNPTIEQIIAAQNPQVAPQPLTPNLNSLMRLTGQGVTMAAEGGIMSLVEAEGGNEKTLISDAIAAIESGTEDEAAAIALAKFVQVHGEDALRDLVEKVQSGDYADTRERFANGENGIVKGPGDGSGTDDKVPATIDGEKDVLLAAGEMVLRKKTTDALEAALGEGGLDAVNAAEGDAPAVLRRLMNNVQAERQTA
jgi:LysM repeat protein